ncbi:MAG: FAD-dependent oxidoreductase [Actinobacteria bacterium]|nr:FAD-dependent oxidoreductase [Actinomycetota bacterium]
MGEVSRRDFLKGAGLVGASAAVAGLAGCSGSASANSDKGATVAAESAADLGRDVAVFETDVLIIGGGVSGLTAARKAASEGQSVLIVDKGPIGHSGTSGINWGHDLATNDWSADDGSESLALWVILAEGMSDQVYDLAMCQALKRSRASLVAEQSGMILQRDDITGEPLGLNVPGPITSPHGFFVRYYAQHCKRAGIPIHERTMVLDILVNDEGVASGAVALDLRNGTARVYRAKTTVLATGNYSWIAGWNGIKPCSISSPENTGDGHRMLLEHGVALRDMEQLPCDFVQWTPLATRQGMGAMGCSIVNYQSVYDKDLNPVTADLEKVAGVTNSSFMRMVARTLVNGKGTENGGVLIDISDVEHDDRYYRRCAENLSRALGYESPQHVEACPEQWETAARPFDMGNTGEVAEVPSLFYAAVGAGAWYGLGFWGAYGSGYLAGESSAAKAASISEIPSVPWEKAKVALDEAYAVLEAEPENGIRASELMKSVQIAYYDGLSFIRDEAGIQATLDEINRIEAEDLPKVFVPSKSKCFNTEWRKALEIKSLIKCAKGTGNAALLRKETRGAHCRTDYPKMDNANWLVATKVRFSEGAFQAEIVDNDMPYIGKDIITASVFESGLEF